MTEQYATFVLDGLSFGVPVTRVQEVIRAQTMTPVPMAPTMVRGLINLRGQILTAFDLGVRMGLGPRPQAGPSMNVVIHGNDGPVALLVDAVGDVLAVDSDTWEAAPVTLSESAREVIPGAFKLPDRLLLQVDLDRALNGDAAARP